MIKLHTGLNISTDITGIAITMATCTATHTAGISIAARTAIMNTARYTIPGTITTMMATSMATHTVAILTAGGMAIMSIAAAIEATVTGKSPQLG